MTISLSNAPPHDALCCCLPFSAIFCVHGAAIAWFLYGSTHPVDETDKNSTSPQLQN